MKSGNIGMGPIQFLAIHLFMHEYFAEIIFSMMNKFEYSILKRVIIHFSKLNINRDNTKTRGLGCFRFHEKSLDDTS